LAQKFDKKSSKIPSNLAMKKNPLEKHCPRPAKKEKGLSQNPAKSP
jgi:hypothetical protein